MIATIICAVFLGVRRRDQRHFETERGLDSVRATEARLVLDRQAERRLPDVQPGRGRLPHLVGHQQIGSRLTPVLPPVLPPPCRAFLGSPRARF